MIPVLDEGIDPHPRVKLDGRPVPANSAARTATSKSCWDPFVAMDTPQSYRDHDGVGNKISSEFDSLLEIQILVWVRIPSQNQLFQFFCEKSLKNVSKCLEN